VTVGAKDPSQSGGTWWAGHAGGSTRTGTTGTRQKPAVRHSNATQSLRRRESVEPEAASDYRQQQIRFPQGLPDDVPERGTHGDAGGVDEGLEPVRLEGELQQVGGKQAVLPLVRKKDRRARLGARGRRAHWTWIR
jgi:hypothetical protein